MQATVWPSEILVPNLPNRWRQNVNSVWTDHYQRPLLTVCLYTRGAEGQSKLQQRPLITNLPLFVKFGTKLMGIRIVPDQNYWYNGRVTKKPESGSFVKLSKRMLGSILLEVKVVLHVLSNKVT